MKHARLKPACLTGGPSMMQILVTIAGREVSLSVTKAEDLGRDIMQVVEEAKRLDVPIPYRPSPCEGVLNETRHQALIAMLHSRGLAFVLNNVYLYHDELAKLVVRTPVDVALLRRVETWIDDRLRDG